MTTPLSANIDIALGPSDILKNSAENDLVIYTSDPSQSILFGVNSNNNPLLKLSGTKINVDSNVKVGINMTNPLYTLHVGGSIGANAYVGLPQATVDLAGVSQLSTSTNTTDPTTSMAASSFAVYSLSNTVNSAMTSMNTTTTNALATKFDKTGGQITGQVNITNTLLTASNISIGLSSPATPVAGLEISQYVNGQAISVGAVPIVDSSRNATFSNMTTNGTLTSQGDIKVNGSVTACNIQTVYQTVGTLQIFGRQLRA
jgi:hypothetical protein